MKIYNCLEIFHKDENNAKVLSYLYLLSIALFVINAIAYYYIYSCSSYETIEFLQALKKDIIHTPIYNLSINDYRYYNDYKYENYIISFLRWKGTELGCKCNRNDKNIITKGGCTDPEISLNCQHYSMYERGFFYYRGKILYAKRKSLFDFYKDLNISKNRKCPKGKKQCGILDSLGNILCLDIYDACPLNDIKIDEHKSIKGYQSLPLNEGKYIHFTNEMINNSIISDISAFQYEPCFYSKENKWDTFFPLEKGKSSGCIERKETKDKDERFKKLDSYNLSKFYDENLYLNYWNMNNLVENKDLYYNSNITLYYRNYIGFNYSNLKGDILRVFGNISNLIKIKEEERLFFADISYYFYSIILKLNGYTAVFMTFLFIVFYAFQKKFQLSTTKDIFIYIFIPDLIIFFAILFKFFSMKKPNITVNEIMDKIYDASDEYTKFGFDKLIKGKITYDLTYFRTKPYFFTIIIISLMIALISFLIYVLGKLIDWMINEKCHCEKEIQTSLITNEQIREINELYEINNN